MLLNRCPRVDELNALAVRDRGSPRLRRHVAACEMCSRILSQLQREATLIAHIRELREDDLDTRTRARVLDICHRAAEVRAIGGSDPH